MQRVILVQQAFEVRAPAALQLSLHQPLSLARIFQPGKVVILPLIGESTSLHLPGQPLAAVETDFYLEGEPRLQAQVHQAKKRMLVIEVQVQTLGVCQHGPDLCAA